MHFSLKTLLLPARCLIQRSAKRSNTKTKAARIHRKAKRPYTHLRRRGGEFEIIGRHFCISNDHLLVYDATKGVLQILEQDPHGDEAKLEADLVLSIGGACQNPGTREARAAWGVYFGPESPYNTSGLLDPALPKTLATAEMEALRQALNIIKAKLISDDFQPRKCIIKTHSSHIKRVFPSLVRRWAAGGGTSVFGELLRDIEECLEDLGYVDGVDRGTNVMFWCAKQEENLEADGLAVDALAQPRDGHEERRCSYHGPIWKLPFCTLFHSSASCNCCQ